MADAPGGAQVMRSTAPFGFRYQYLAGGVNTGHGWSTWDPDGAFVSSYVAESRAAGIVPVFSYYMLTQSNPGAATGGEPGTIANLKDRSTMSAYYADLQLFFARARAVGGEVVLHVEPDLWGFMEHEARSDDAATVPVVVGSSGVSAVAGLPDTAAGLAQAIVRLRDADAPNVVLAYHASPWAAGTDILYAKPADATVAALGVRSANFYRSLGARFDLAFTDLTDRDAAFKQFVYHDGGASWYSPDDYRRNTIFIANFVHTAGIRAALWQVPLGNTKMRADNNTTGHYQDNKVEWLLDDAGRAHLLAYARAGVIAVLFGGGATGTTCACDADHDGVTNPPPINGNTGLSLSADDDGGFFRNRAASYYSIGALPIGG